MNRVFIRVLTPTDLPSMLIIEKHAHFNPWSQASLNSCFCKQNIVIGIFVEDSLAGYLIAQILMDEASVLNVCIEPSLQGLGYGDLLLAHFMRTISATPKVTQCYLEVRASNQAARSLYTKHGFHETGRRKNYYSKPYEDAVLMTHTRCA
jgi:ribosomal-protein-alanine N-acetyltransferase